MLQLSWQLKLTEVTILARSTLSVCFNSFHISSIRLIRCRGLDRWQVLSKGKRFWLHAIQSHVSTNICAWWCFTWWSIGWSWLNYSVWACFWILFQTGVCISFLFIGIVSFKVCQHPFDVRETYSVHLAIDRGYEHASRWVVQRSPHCNGSTDCGAAVFLPTWQ